jgi:Permuted papain-like amidase enzyme, YaeF/YiiX, C92 family
MKRFYRWSGYIFGLLATLAAGLYVWLGLTAVSAADLPPLKAGDIVFQTTGGQQSLAILMASRSPYTHTGIIEIDAAGKPWVVEAVGPVTTTALDAWIANGHGGRITVKRVKGLSPADAAKAIARAHDYDGLPYDIFFLNGRDAIYCSELVEAAFSEGAGIKLGAFEKVRDLHLDNSAARKLIEARWKKHPLCQSEAASTFEACYGIILDQTLVTPASIARDPRLEMVTSNFGIAGE